jgi:hypothetical protein
MQSALVMGSYSSCSASWETSRPMGTARRKNTVISKIPELGELIDLRIVDHLVNINNRLFIVF